MTHHIQQHLFVNQKPLLFLDESKTPFVREIDGSITPIPNNVYGRWFLRANYFGCLDATKEGRIWFNEISPLKIPKIEALKSELKIHQILAVFRAGLSSCAFWMDMGLGKTLSILAFLRLVFEKGNGTDFLVVCPNSVFVSWEDDVDKHFESGAFNLVLAHGRKKKKRLQELRVNRGSRPNLILTSYDTLGNIHDELALARPTFLIFDESQKIKNPKALRTKAAFRLRNELQVRRVICMSGTPSTTAPNGFYSQYEILGKGWSGSPDFFTFKKRYEKSVRFARVMLPHGEVAHVYAEDEPDRAAEAELDGKPRVAFQEWLQKHYPPQSEKNYFQLGFQFDFNEGPKTIQILNFYDKMSSFQNLDHLEKITKRVSFVLKKETVLKDLPPKTFTRRSVTMTQAARKLYMDVMTKNKDVLEKLELNFNDRSSPYCKLHQICNGFIYDENKTVRYLAKDPKLEALEDIVETLNDQKLVIWCPYRPQIEAVVQFLRKKGFSVGELHGGTPTDQRKTLVRNFQNEIDPQIIVSNPEVGGAGITLTRAFVEVFMANWSKPETRLQAIDRLHRIGQLNAVSVIDIVMEDTLDVTILRNLSAGIRMENRVLTGEELKGKA